MIRHFNPAGWIPICCGMLLLGAVGLVAATAPSAKDSAKEPPQDDREKQTCINNLMLIHKAIQAFRKDHKELPNWISLGLVFQRQTETTSGLVAKC